MTNKEFACPNCGDFEARLDIPICPQCGSIARRVFRTAPTISTGIVAKSDYILAAEFKRQGISNFTNVNGIKVEYDRPLSTGSGELQPAWGKPGLDQINQKYGTHFTPPELSGPPVAEIPLRRREPVTHNFGGMAADERLKKPKEK
jgi:hypothetical protein